MLYPRLVRKDLEDRGLREQAISREDLKNRVAEQLKKREEEADPISPEQAKIIANMAKVEIMTE